MLNTDQILFIIIVIVISTFILIGLFTLINKSNVEKRELIDLEKRITAQEQISSQCLTNLHMNNDMFEPAKIRQNRHEQKTNHLTLPPPIVIMTPKKEKRIGTTKQFSHESLLNKVYGFKFSSRGPSPTLSTIRPSSVRSPSFLPMQEKSKYFIENIDPPAYNDHHASTPVIPFI
ncbi:uncharacterized protein BX663DRAFT_496786 [Cokeromyces recurvatus]|uniref:uncharacterized protein n=1 Tax=Cokeromyces recurvatus TaxID=90255 RepID=UPI00221FE21E|nr:uncharacterized protein BX663DRAFT_496786 [Cokeromyces recurvatus]KAI7906534.1 hypothetical protein BX663DRAFT_496786 [Cokeromyces recurvatus]